MTLQASFSVGARGVEATLEVAAGETLAVLGPNGAGKSTVLGVLAGLVRPDRGRGTLRGRALFDTGSGDREVWVPAHARRVALMAQEPRLFPHLSALDNVAFGPRSQGARRSRARRLARGWLESVDAADLAARRPAQLSGGQAQRVALARALAADPELLLLDEPMAALDVAVAPAMRQLLREALRDRAAVVVTHDVLDAALLADRVVVLDGGRVVEDGRTETVLSRPRSPFSARIAGLNLLRGRSRGTAVVTDAGLHVEGMPEDGLRDGDAAVAVFSPNAVAVYRTAPTGSPRNVMTGVVTEVEPHGHQVRIRIPGVTADVTPAAVAELDLAPGVEVVFTVKASEVAVYPA